METKSNFSELIVDKKKTSEWRESLFLITINTNKSYKSRDPQTIERMPAIKAEFEDLLHNLFDRRNLIKLLVDLGPTSKKPIGKVREDQVKNIEANTQLEVNEAGRAFLHAHTTIKVIHNSRVQVNLPLVRTVVQKKMAKVLTYGGQTTKPFVSVRGRTTLYKMEEYVKNPV